MNSKYRPITQVRKGMKTTNSHLNFSRYHHITLCKIHCGWSFLVPLISKMHTCEILQVKGTIQILSGNLSKNTVNRFCYTDKKI